MFINWHRFSLLLNSKAAKLKELRDTNTSYLEELARLKPVQQDEPGMDDLLAEEVCLMGWERLLHSRPAWCLSLNTMVSMARVKERIFAVPCITSTHVFFSELRFITKRTSQSHLSPAPTTFLCTT